MDFSLVPEKKYSGILALKKKLKKREKKGSPHKNVIATQKKKKLKETPFSILSFKTFLFLLLF
jgi:hypothetical protein